MQKLLIGFFLAILFFLCTVAISIAEESDRLAKLAEGAKKEGKILFYTGMNMEHARKFVNKFQEKYPFIKGEVYRTDSEKLTARILIEASTGKLNADVIQTTAVEANLFKKKGIILKYLSLGGATFPESAKDPEGFWVSVYEQWFILGYNTKRVSPTDIPKTYEDLLNPKWKGQLAMDGKEIRWFGALEHVWGRKKWLDFMNKYAQQGITLRNGKTLLTQLLGAGEYAIAMPLYPTDTEGMKKSGAPVDSIFLDPVLVNLHPLIVNSTAPHKHAAQLFLEFMYSEEGQELIASVGRIPSKPMDINKIFPSFQGRRVPKKFAITPQLAEQLSENARELRSQFKSLFVQNERLK